MWIFLFVFCFFELLCSGSQQMFKISSNVCLGAWEFHRMFVWAYLPNCLNFNVLLPNLVWWCITMSQTVFWKDCFATIKVKVRVTAHMIRIWLFLLYHLSCWSFFQSDLLWWHIIVSLVFVKIIGLLCPKQRLQWWFKISLNVCQFYSIFSVLPLSLQLNNVCRSTITNNQK